MSTEPLNGAQVEAGARRLADIDWSTWQARDPATLVFVMQDDEILLIRKKRGLGPGKINGPGGKLDPGETAMECAVRECHEELGIEVHDLECMGEHRFQFTDGYSIHCWVFRTDRYDGEAVETAEAVPLWTPVDRIPYDEMWEDDRIWLPLVIRGQHFSARWVFEHERMLDYDLQLVDRVAPGGRREA
ncbi:MAG: NUDIX domain-containing protein [Xanthomonadales bacterium]|nr:NUDIX domain-containing protein [Xanthomonadales bacterium]NIN60329.1 NUDIX domain-containing protein [Xanthomonadales bacterium]NIN75681.1 NUDIX domain-containing protein [Xanthomonadales bacterium]NIO14754.1 NUDIX domain-containing protein [Xanthomonadales bacterium]NIP12722.1 NUDIX domain-containing protein [Xanthomonadales bacterium]